jgi:glycosyltransferase involved in cell wall biosynthesis
MQFALIAAGHKLELHIAGEGECEVELAAMARTRPWLIFAGVILDRAAFLRDKHAFLLPSEFEGMPLALAEAMAAGIPPIISDLPSLRDMAGDAAMYVPVGNLTLFAQAMTRLVLERNLRDRLSMNARSRAEAFDIRGVATQYFEIYKRLDESRQTVPEAV